MPKVSIVTTTYKHQDFIAHTIKSVLSQTYIDRELLIGDDSPDDTTWEIIQEYVHKYPDKIKARHHKPNKGIVDNMNFLIDQADSQSEYISFLEWDDMYTSDNLQEKMKVFEQYPEVKLVYSDLSFVNKDNKIILRSFFSYRSIPYYKNQTIPQDKFILSGAGPIASRSTAMVRQNILKQYQIRSLDSINKAYSVSDYDLYFQIATQNQVYGIEKILTQYRRHNNNLSWAWWGTSHDLELLMDYYRKQNFIDNDVYNKKMSWIYIVYSIFSLESWDKHKTYQYLRKSINYDTFAFVFWKFGIIWLLVLPSKRSIYILAKLIKRG